MDALRALMGTPDRGVSAFTRGIRATTHRHFDAHVVPLVEREWPALMRSSFSAKLRIGTCDLYASAPYTALFCSEARPPLVRAVTAVANGLPLSPATLSLLGRGAMEVIGRLDYGGAHRRIVIVAAFIVVVDHVFDHCMTEPAEARGAKLLDVMDGRRAPDSDPLRLVRALVLAMGNGLGPRDQIAFDAAMERVRGWIRAEVRAMAGEADPSGLGHRLAGVEGTIEGLLFPVARYASDGTRRWMVDVSMFVQVMDDWLDYELDLDSGRPTPVTTGVWTLADVSASWEKTLSGIVLVVRAAGLSSPHYVALVRESYVLMMHEVMEAMAARPSE